MKLKLEMEIDNAAFDDAGELARCLAVVANKIEEPWDEQLKHPRTAIYDGNGNKVGWFVVE